jgi:hypothetical protein
VGDQEYTIEKKILNNVLLGKIPIMIKSNYCILSKYKKMNVNMIMEHTLLSMK